jgi:hypothetical protein
MPSQLLPWPPPAIVKLTPLTIVLTLFAVLVFLPHATTQSDRGRKPRQAPGVAPL